MHVLSLFFFLNLSIELKWRDTLAFVAEDYNKKCIWAHSSQRHQSYLEKTDQNRDGCFGDYCIGENLATSTYTDSTKAIDVAM